MATDISFYEWARRAPDALASLAGVHSRGYRWSSVVLKGLERRLDGVLEPQDSARPLLFVEFQAYRDPGLLWRWLQGIVTYLVQRRYIGPVTGLVVYLKAGDEAGVSLELGWERSLLLRFQPRSLVLGDMEPQELLDSNRPELWPLLPLTRIAVSELPRALPRWADGIKDSSLPAELRGDLLGLLGAFASHRLPALAFDELAGLLGGISLKDTPLGQMLLEEGRKEGRQEGRLQEARALLLDLSRERFGAAPEWLVQWSETRQDPAEVEAALRELIKAPDLDAFHQRLSP